MSPQASSSAGPPRGTAAAGVAGRFAVTLAGVALIALGALAALRPGRVWGDEGTYLAMAASLVRDGDLRFDERDRERLLAAPADGSREVILQRAGGGVFYSKPTAYVLYAAPFFALLGARGLVLANAAALGAALVLAGAWLRRRAPSGEAGLLLVTFAAGGAFLPYVAWRMSDAFQAALSLAGLVLTFAGLDAAPPEEGRVGRFLRRPGAAILGAALLGVLSAQRHPHALLAVAPVAAALLLGRRRRAAALVVAALLACALAAGFDALLTGAVNPYRAVRSGFNAETGYPLGNDAAGRRFADAPTTSAIVWRPEFDARVSAYASLYFLVGRHTGVLVYFPAAAVFAAAALRRRTAAGAALLLCAGALALFYLVWMPRNYFGGDSFLGNRYFLMIYPALLVAAARPPRPRALVAVWLVATAVGASAMVSVARTRGRSDASQNHAWAGIFRALPYESTAAKIEGRADRSWSGEWLRFVDPYARAGEWSFTLRAGDPAAEIELANQRATGAAHFLVVSDAPPGATLEYRDWGRRRTLRLAPAAGGARGLVAVEPARPWRRHSFWWPPGDPLWVRTFRLALRAPAAPGGRRATAEIRYLGFDFDLEAACARQALAAVLPERAAAAATSRVPIRVRNTSPRPWATAAALPIVLGYRLLAGEGGTPLAEGRAPIAAAVAPGETLAQAVEVRWPAAPGRYRLEVDLVAEGLAWCGAQSGAPLAQGWVEVE